MKAIVLCGGGGTRLWPESTPDNPKQFLALVSSHSLLAETVLRLLPILRPEDIVLVTGERYRERAIAELHSIGCSEAHIVCEPAARNTAPAIALALSYLRDELKIAEREPVFVAPSDHVISNGTAFVGVLQQAKRIIESRSAIVTFGIVPNYPETGYGYIEASEQLAIGYSVSKFHEKPDYERAHSYVDAGNYYWNSGMFMFNCHDFFVELSAHAMDVAQYFDRGYRYALQHFADIPKISIDYAVAEKTTQAVVIPFDGGWSDVGSWDSLYDICQKDDDSNVVTPNTKYIDCHNVMVRANKRVAIAGLEDVIIIDSTESLLVIKRGESQTVKELSQN